MVEERLYPCNINGKYYFKKFDIDESIKEQADNIVNDLETRLNDESSNVYKDEEFEQYIKSVKNGEIEAIFHPSKPLFLMLFEIALLEFGSYELVEILLINSPDEKAQSYLEYLDKRIVEIQNAIIQSTPSATKMLQKAYCNFLENFAPQRLSYYTSNPVNYDILNGVVEMKKASAQEQFIAEVPELSEKVNEFIDCYLIEAILKVFKLYDKYYLEINENKKNKILKSIENIIKKGISINGNNRALVNLAKWNLNEIIEKMIDNIVIRLVHYNCDENLDVSEDFENLLEKVNELKDNFSLEELYNKNRIFHKLLQISNLGILPEKEGKKLSKLLKNEFGLNDIKDVDISRFDEKILENKFSASEFEEFYKSLMLLTIKEGQMPIKYNEFLITKFIEEEFVNVDDSQRLIVLEYFAKTKAKQLLGTENYITFSNNFTDEDGILVSGDHKVNYINLKPASIKSPSMSTVLNIITIFHELRHKGQRKDMNIDNYNYLEYIMLKEEIFKNINIDYYDKNYSNMYDEFDAEHFALEKTLSFIKTLPLSEEFYNSEKWQEILNVVNKKLKETKQVFKRSKNKKRKIS